MWYDEAVIYQIYPLGLCGAPLQNDGDPSQADQHRLLRVLDWVDHIKALGATCVLFNPLFESDAHGYDTRDYNKVDGRLGTNDDLKQVCAALHAAGIRVHAGRRVQPRGPGLLGLSRTCRRKSGTAPTRTGSTSSFDGNTNYNDGFWYEGWEGHNELVKLNLQQPGGGGLPVRRRAQLGARSSTSTACGWTWPTACDLDFLRQLRGFANSLKPDFVLVGETLHGDYNRWMNDHDAATA